MKPAIVYQIICVLLSTPLWNGCDLVSNQAIEPGVSIYKTKSDYFNLVDIGMDGNKIFRRSSFSNDKSKLLISEEDTLYKRRTKLVHGYILDLEADFRYDVFLDLTFKRHLLLEIELNLATLPDDTLKNHILDKSPYIEFYQEIDNTKKFNFNDTSQLNNIIRQGKLEEYFTRIK